MKSKSKYEAVKNKLHERAERLIKEYADLFMKQFGLNSEQCKRIDNGVTAHPIFRVLGKYDLSLSTIIYAIENDMASLYLPNTNSTVDKPIKTDDNGK